MSAKGCNLNNEEKIEMIKEAIANLNLDALLSNKANAKWNSINVDKMERIIKKQIKES